jgi:nucleotide-binding universal stress UspA family protein
MYKRILVPTDGSDAANRGLAEAIPLAKALGANILLAHVVNERRAIPADMPGLDLRAFVEEARGEGEQILALARERVRLEAVEVDTRLLEVWSGRVGDEVIRLAKEWPADLIVCGTHGRRGVRRLVLGSDAEHIVRHSPVPVLLVRASVG